MHSAEVMKFLQITLYNFSEVKYNPVIGTPIQTERKENYEKVYLYDAGRYPCIVSSDRLRRLRR